MKLESMKGFVRPYLAFLFSTAIAIVGTFLTLKFADREVARLVLMFMLAEGSTILGFYFGERSQKKKE